jgi:hypothetical protein
VTCLDLLRDDVAHGGKEWRQKKPVPGVAPREKSPTGVS